MAEAPRFQARLAWLRFARRVHGGDCRCQNEPIAAEEVRFEEEWDAAYRAGLETAAEQAHHASENHLCGSADCHSDEVVIALRALQEKGGTP